jgi:hypothetical protein
MTVNRCKAVKLACFSINIRLGRWLQLTFLFFISLPKRRMYVLHQVAIIWVLPVFSTIGKKMKKGEPSDLIFFGGQKVELFLIFFGSPTCL